MKISVASLDTPWSLPDEQCPDVYHTAGYGMAAAFSRFGRWELLHWEDRILLPYVVTDTGRGHVDAASPYGYAGIHIASGCTERDVRSFWRIAGEHWQSAGLVSMFLRMSPLDPGSLAAAAALDDVTMTRRGDTITVPLTAGSKTVWDGMEGRARTTVRKATAGGMTAEVRVAAAPDLCPGAPFRRVYEETMGRVGCAAGYRFPDSYYDALLAGLGPNLHIAEVRAADGEVVSAALVMRHHDRAHYHLSGSMPEGAKAGANNLLLWTILEWAIEAGCTLVHLGGGLASDDSLFRFKRSFGGERSEFWTGTAVLDAGTYDKLVAARAEELGRPVDELMAQPYFPAYRLEI
jgi:serine/alanine adding enzyme